MTTLRFLLSLSAAGGFLLAPALASAADAPLFSNAVQKEIPDALPQAEPDLPQELPSATEQLGQQLAVMQERLRNASLDDLRNNPSLAEDALNLAIVSRNWDAVAEILPIYRESPNADAVLVDYAQGALYSGDGEYKKAIALYRKLIADNPELSRVRMDLAILLYADKQDTAARDQFVRLRSESGNDGVLNELIDDFITRIDERSAWSYSAGLSYLRDDNINNASSSPTISLGNLKFQKRPEALPQRGQGFEFSLGADKDFNIAGSHYWSLDASAHGKIYWNKHEYDDIGLRVSTGYKYKDARANFAFTPFARVRYFDSDPYSKTYGFSLSGGYWLSPNWQISSYNEFAWEKSDVNKQAPTEKQRYASVNALWARNAEQIFTFGANVFDVNTGTKSSSYIRPGVNVAWNQDWGFGGVSTRLGLGYAQRDYKAVNYMGIKRKDNEYNVDVSLWKRDWHLWGITPKLNVRYNKVNSNIDDLYTYDKAAVFLKFDKTF